MLSTRRFTLGEIDVVSYGLLGSANRPRLVPVISGKENLTRAIVTEKRHKAQARLLAAVGLGFSHSILSAR